MTELEQRIARLREQLARTDLYPQQRRALERELSIALADQNAPPVAPPAGE